MKKIMKKIFMLVIVSATILTVGCSKDEKSANMSKAEDIHAKELKKNKDVIEAFGIIKSNDVKNIAIDFSAYIEKVHVKEGQQVKQGDNLVTLNTNGYNAELKSKENRLNIIQLEKSRIENTSIEDDQNETAIKKGTNTVAFAEKLYIQEQKDFAIKEELFKEGAISKSQIEEAKKVLDTRYKELEDSKYDLEYIKNNTKNKTNKKDDLKVKDGEIASELHNLATLKDKLKRSYINGNNIVCDVNNAVVYEIGYQAGDFVDISKKLLSIANLDNITVEAEVAEEFIKDVKIGAQVKIIPLSDKEKEYKGKVVRISNRAIEKNGDTIIPVEISIENNDGFLIPNFNVDVMIKTEH